MVNFLAATRATILRILTYKKLRSKISMPISNVNGMNLKGIVWKKMVQLHLGCMIR